MRAVKLSFGCSHGTIHHLRNLGVLVALDVVQFKDQPVADGQLRDSALQADSVDRAIERRVIATNLSEGLRIRIGEFHHALEWNLRGRLTAQAHEHQVYSHAMQPSGKSRLSAKQMNLPK